MAGLLHRQFSFYVIACGFEKLFPAKFANIKSRQDANLTRAAVLLTANQILSARLRQRPWCRPPLADEVS